MRLKHVANILEAEEAENPISALSWSPNNTKLAIATCDRAILLFDSNGNRRDKFNTKPADASAGRKSYVITAIAFSSNSEMIGIAQSDGIVFVYRIGADWNGKKVICNKFPLAGAPTALLWSGSMFVTSTLEGKVRALDCKTNKSTTIWSGATACVSLAGAPPTRLTEHDGPSLVSGHADGTIYVIVGGCDNRVCIYDMHRGSIVRNVDKNVHQLSDKKDLTMAASSPSGQTIIFGTWDGCLIGEIKDNGALDMTILNIPNLYATRAITWNADGTKVAIASLTGAVLLYEAILKRWVWHDVVEVRHVSPKRILITRLAQDAAPMVVETIHGNDIFNVRFMGNDWYAVCRTNSSLIVCDITRGLQSEVLWPNGGGERFYMQVGKVCLIHRAGELSVIEYGVNGILVTVRTEKANPHVLSVRINETGRTDIAVIENKKLAYLLDKQTIAVMDLVTGVHLIQSWHDARIDWLELSESAHVLLARDVRRRLMLLSTETARKEIIASGVGFVQWVENTNAVVAQTALNLIVWYSIDEPTSVELLEAGGGVAVDVNTDAEARIIMQDGSMPYVPLDTARLHFNASLCANDLDGCLEYLSTITDSANVALLWHQLANRAIQLEKLEIAVKCFSEMGDAAKAFFLKKTIQLAKDGDSGEGLNSPIVKARMSILRGELKDAETIFVKEANQPGLAIDMYKALNCWQDAVTVAELADPAAVSSLKEQHMKYLLTTGRGGEAGAVLAARGESREALELWLRHGRPRRAARLMLQTPHLLADNALFQTVVKALVADEWWETAGELSERRGDHMTAVQHYANGKNFARAVQLAREACPSEVTTLEQEWGTWLVTRRQAGAAVAHLIEAGDTKGALAAALTAQHWKKALHIIQVIENPESVKEYYEKLGEHFISTQEWETAEKVMVSGGLVERCVAAYNEVGRYGDGLRLALQHMEEESVKNMYMEIASQLKMQDQLRKAEVIYVGLGEFDEAILMYKEVSQYENMLRLVATHRSELLETTRKHVAQVLQAEGQLKAAEKLYLDAGDWKTVIQMYRAAGQWENADRIAQQHAPPQVQQQVAFLWASERGDEAGARLLRQRGLLGAGVRWACGAHRWSLALALCAAGAPMMADTVYVNMAAALVEEGKLEEAEAAYLRGGSPEDAVTMWLHANEHVRALQMAESHAPNKVNEVLQIYANWAAEQGDLSLYEALMIRANRPRDVVCGVMLCVYVASIYLGEVNALASEGHHQSLPAETGGVPPHVPELLQKAAAFANRGAYWQAVIALLDASEVAAADELGVAERAALRAARLARDHLPHADIVRAAPLVYDRLSSIGQEEVGEQLRNALLSRFASGDQASPDATAELEEVGSERTQLDELARTGQWERCLNAAASVDTVTAQRYAALYAAHLLQVYKAALGNSDTDPTDSADGVWSAARTLLQYGGSAPSALCEDLLTLASAKLDAPFELVRDVRDVLHSSLSNDKESTRRVEASHLLCVVEGCTGVKALLPLAIRASLALLRYTDLIVADRAFFLAGNLAREDGERMCEAFVLLNRCLDLIEAAEEGSRAMLDHTDFENTDFPSNVLLLSNPSVQGDRVEDVREWVLSMSMDQSVDQSLPLDSRSLFESCLSPGQNGCVLTGYPLSNRLVNFSNGRSANRDAWARLQAAARADPTSPAADIMNFITLRCGTSDYSLS